MMRFRDSPRIIRILEECPLIIYNVDAVSECRFIFIEVLLVVSCEYPFAYLDVSLIYCTGLREKLSCL